MARLQLRRWDRVEGRATGCRDCGFDDGIEAAPDRPWSPRHLCILHIIEGRATGCRDCGFDDRTEARGAVQGCTDCAFTASAIGSRSLSAACITGRTSVASRATFSASAAFVHPAHHRGPCDETVSLLAPLARPASRVGAVADWTEARGAGQGCTDCAFTASAMGSSGGPCAKDGAATA